MDTSKLSPLAEKSRQNCIRARGRCPWDGWGEHILERLASEGRVMVAVEVPSMHGPWYPPSKSMTTINNQP